MSHAEETPESPVHDAEPREIAAILTDMRRLAATVLALSLVAACGGGDDDEAASTTTTEKSTTTTLQADIAEGAFPLTGQPGNNSPNLSRVTLAIKYDNAPKARMQAGLNRADVIYEEKVEDGVTRFLALFHSDEPTEAIGPIRSARTTDIALLVPLNRPLFAYSGTNDVFQKAIDTAPLVDLSPNKANVYFRQRGRPAPYNLFSTTRAFFGLAPQGAQPPPNLFAYRAEGAPFEGAGIAPANGVNVVYKGRNITTIADWTWNASAGVYERSTDGVPHLDAIDNSRVNAKNLIVQFADYVDTGERDTSGEPVPEGKLVGEGEAWIFSDGKLVKGRWSKASMEAVTVFTDSDGKKVRLAPGRTWLEIPPPGSATLR